MKHILVGIILYNSVPVRPFVCPCVCLTISIGDEWSRIISERKLLLFDDGMALFNAGEVVFDI